MLPWGKLECADADADKLSSPIADSFVSLNSKLVKGEHHPGPSALERLLMNSSDATPDNSPPSSPSPFLLPPKGNRQTTARPRKPQHPKDVLMKFQGSTEQSVKDKAPAVTKPRSASTTQPRKRLPKKEKPVVEKDFIVRPLVEKPLLERTVFNFPEPLSEKPLLHFLEKPLSEKPLLNAFEKYPLNFNEKSAIDFSEKPPFSHSEKLLRHFHERPLHDRPVHEKPVHERPPQQWHLSERPFHEKPLERHHLPERPLNEKPLLERHPHERSLHVKPPLERQRHEKSIPERPVHERPHHERPVPEKPLLLKLPKKPVAKAPKVENFPLARPLFENPLLLKLPKKSNVKPSKVVVAIAPKPQKKAKRKDVMEQQEEATDSGREIRFSILAQERQMALEAATNRLESLLEETTMMVNELQKEEEDVQRLQEEKERLLDELLVWEGLVSSLHTPLNSMVQTKKPKRAKR